MGNKMCRWHRNDEIQMEVAVAGAIAPNGQRQPEVFKLDADCWDEVFDCLSLVDVHSFGQTCKAFQRIVGRYFQWKYAAVSVHFSGNKGHSDGDRYDGFSKFVKRIDCFLHLELNFESVNVINLVQINFHQLKMNSLDALNKVEHLTFRGCTLDENNFGAFIGSCKNLKRLDLVHIKLFPSTIRNHSTLEHLGLQLANMFAYDQLKDILENSPNIRSLRIDSHDLWNKRKSLLRSNVKLDDLSIDFNGYSYDDVHALLMDLHAHDFYKRLHLCSFNVPPPDRLLTLQGLVAMYIYVWKNIEWPVLVNVRELGFYDNLYSVRHGNDNSTALPQRLINLEQLFICRAGNEELLPFIRHSINLKCIEIHEFEGKVLKIHALNNERKKLEGARKVTIYVKEVVYLATKWAKAETSLELIEIRRRDSHDIIRPHDFWSDYRNTFWH